MYIYDFLYKRQVMGARGVTHPSLQPDAVYRLPGVAVRGVELTSL